MLYSICSYTFFIFILYDIWWLHYTRHSPNVLHMHITFNTIVCIYTVHFTLTDFELIDNVAPQLCSLLDTFKEKMCGHKCTRALCFGC